MALKAFAAGSLFGERFGAGSPVLLALHGWGRDRGDFSVVLNGLPALALDLPGFGASPPPAVVGGAADFAAAVAPVLAEFSRPAVVVGHSFGGRVAVCLAARNPERVAHVVLIGVPLLRVEGRSAGPRLRYRMWRALHRVRLVGEERMERVRRRYGSADYREASGVMRGVLVRVLAESYEDQLAALNCPVTLIWGEADREVPVEVGRRVEELLRGQGTEVSLRVLPGVGHHPCLEAPEQVREELLRWAP